ncbi:TetR/AcrR family transcriptional regulator [Clostridium paridis]|uniref:TetR/AcrR family transcriptional regulator n=1 Tax=Clostridium paridis TaxID=2803863 RepID=A0A937K5Z8_9CLOT|nr:TetR/AcrR family transcriptional regulator [Clostridium paridis]MBL4933674.1 TetR/AcrR family transcriptional regulator [Clostridium paridis]
MPKIIENLRDKILDEGKKALIEQGYKNASIRDITKACGIGTGTFYNYFNNKGELAVEVFERDWSMIIISIQAIVKADISLKDKLFQIFLYVDGFLKNHISVFVEMSKEDYTYNEVDVMAPLYEAIEEILLFHKNKGDITSSVELAKLTKFLVYNLTNISKQKFMTFDEFYALLNL